MTRKIIQNFLEMMVAEKGASENTVMAYRRDLLQFFEIIKTEPNAISRKNIIDYITEINNLWYAQKSQARKLSALREFCKFLVQEKFLTDNPCLNISAPKPKRQLPNFLSFNQIKLLTEAANSVKSQSFKRASVMINLMFSTGLRISEVICLTKNSINRDKKIVTVMGKGNKERIVPIANETIETVFNYVDRISGNYTEKSNSWLFPSHTSKSGHITRQTFFRTLKQLAVVAELNPNIISPHTLRHSFATNLINHDADIRSVQKMLGHENIVTTEIYTHIIKEKLIDTVMQKHPLANVNFKDD